MDFESWLRAKRMEVKKQVADVDREIATFKIQIESALRRVDTLRGAYVALVEAEKQLLDIGSDVDDYLR